VSGKGSRPRKVDKAKYDAEYARIFGKPVKAPVIKPPAK